MELPEFPDQFHPEMRLGLRIALMDFVIREIRSDFTNNMKSILDQIVLENKGVDRPSAFIFITKQIEQKTKPYIRFISDMRNQMFTTLNKAIVLFEQLVNDAYTSPMPHDRLRILYTKKHDFDRAIQACERYIEILTAFNEFDKSLSNIHLVPSYEKYIAKLKANREKLTTNS